MAYTEDKAFELIQSAHERGRLGHAFIISGSKQNMESLATRVVNLINKEDPNAGPKKRLEAKPKAKAQESSSSMATTAEVAGGDVNDGGDLDLPLHLKVN